MVFNSTARGCPCRFCQKVNPMYSLVHAGTTFSIVRNFKWYQQYNAQLRQAGSLAEVLASNTGELYYFNGENLPCIC
jgi:hypothetical protein